MGLQPRDVLSWGSAAAFQKDIARPCSGVEPRGLWRHCRKDRTPIDVEITAVDLKYGDFPSRLVLAIDISARRRREQEALEVQTMETIAHVPAAVPHRR